MLEEDIDLPESDEEDEETGSFEHYRFISDKGQTPMRVDKFITKPYGETSRHRM
jgi:23S rRNA pseudouridine1911/1915/1917 synthase